MTTIYLIRHAEAEGNLFRRAQGHWNGKITERGKKQIDALAGRFKDIHIDAVYSSDLDRAVETAGALLRGRNLELHTTRQLREIHMGVWEGDSWGNLSYRWPEQMYNFNNDPDRWVVPGAESFARCRARMTAAIAEIAAAHDGQTIGVVAHGMCIKIFLMAVMGIQPNSPEAMAHGDNTSVSLLHYDGGKFEVEYYNDNSHLGELSTFAKQQWWRDTTKDDPTSLRFEPLNPRDKREAEFYTGCYRDSWIAAHGSDAGFMSSVYLSSARSPRGQGLREPAQGALGRRAHWRAGAGPQARQGGQLRLDKPVLPQAGVPRAQPGRAAHRHGLGLLLPQKAQRDTPPRRRHERARHRLLPPLRLPRHTHRPGRRQRPDPDGA